MKLRIRLPTVAAIDEKTPIVIELRDLNIDDVGKELVVAIAKDRSLIDCFPYDLHLHIRPYVGDRIVVHEEVCTRKGLNRIRIEVRICEVVHRRPELRKDIVIHRNPHPKMRIVPFTLDNSFYFAELLAGGGVVLHRSGPRLKNRGSILRCDERLLEKTKTLICVESVNPLYRFIKFLKHVLHIVSKAYR